MKKSTLLIILIILSLTSNAQKNWVSVRLHDLQIHHITTTDPTYDLSNKSWLLLPAVGYYRLIGDTWGVGCEAGYALSKTDYDNTITFLPSNNITIEYYGSRTKQYYFCPSLFEMFAWKRYRFTTSLALPVTYATDITLEQRRDETYRADLSTYGRNNVVTAYPDQLSIGIFCNLGVQRKLFKGLYCGPQIGIGLFYNTSDGDQQQTITVSDQKEIKTVTIVTTHTQNTDMKFDIRQAFSISYNF